MLEDMVQIKIAVEGMKAQIIKCFDAEQIANSIKAATKKAVEAFDMNTYLQRTIEDVFEQARENAISDLAQEYSSRWTEDISKLIDKKIDQALKSR